MQHARAARDGGERGAEANEASRRRLKHQPLLALRLQGKHLEKLEAGQGGQGARVERVAQLGGKRRGKRALKRQGGRGPRGGWLER